MKIKSRRRERGAALVEFALVAFLLCFIILAIVEFSTRYSTNARANNAAFSAARYLAVHHSEVGAATTAKNNVVTALSAYDSDGSPITASNITTTSCDITNASTSDDNITVTVAYNSFQSVTSAFGATFGITTSAVVRCES